MLQFENISTTVQKIVDSYLFSKTSLYDNAKKILVASLYASMESTDQNIVEILNPYIENLNNSLLDSDVQILKDNYDSVIRYCYSKKDPSFKFFTRKFDSRDFLIPNSVLELCKSLLDLDKMQSANVFLPYAGSTQFAFLHPNFQYEGFENDSELWAFSQVFLKSFYIDSSIRLASGMSTFIPKGKQYDLIFSFPPYHMGPAGSKVIDVLYYLATQSLKENGTFCCILPASFCSASSGWLDMRKILVDYRNDYSATVISLPRVFIPFIGFDICLFVLKKDHKGEVLLMDATDEYFSTQLEASFGGKILEINPNRVLEVMKGEHSNERFVWRGNISQLIGEYNLLPSRYLIQNNLPVLKNGEELIPLRDLIEIVPTKRAPMVPAGPLLGFKELSFNFLNCDVDTNNILEKQNHSYKVLTGNSLLAGFMSGRFKVGRIVDFSEEKTIFIRHEIFPFRIISDKISEDFLLRSILSDYVIRQAKMMSAGFTISRLKVQEFLELKIIVPSLKEQERICKEETKQSLQDADSKQKEADDEFRRDMHMKKHAIGQTIFNLKNWWKTLQRARTEGNGIVYDNAVIGNSHKVSVKDIYDNIQQTIEQLQLQISKFDRGNGLVVEDFSLNDFIEDYIAKHKSPLFQFDYNATVHQIQIDEESITVSDIPNNGNIAKEHAIFAPEALTIIFDNIISNACSHGFEGREEHPENNIVRIELTTAGSDHIITISNNGFPVPENVTEKYVFTYNMSTRNGKGHYGIGGYEVKRLMREFEGDAEFITNSDSDFPVAYKLIFHNTGV